MHNISRHLIIVIALHVLAGMVVALRALIVTMHNIEDMVAALRALWALHNIEDNWLWP